MPSILQRSDYEDFLIRECFDSDGHELKDCYKRAYRDLSRTLHGIKSHPNIRFTAEKALHRMVQSVQDKEGLTQMQFDRWHQRTCMELVETYKVNDYPSFYIGQAQKWLNMTFKYVYVLGDERLPGFAHLYDLCHVPLDKIVIKGLRPFGLEGLPCAWSRLNDYDTYLARQHWVRSRFHCAPLDVEFQVWMGRSVDTCANAV